MVLGCGDEDGRTPGSCGSIVEEENAFGLRRVSQPSGLSLQDRAYRMALKLFDVFNHAVFVKFERLSRTALVIQTLLCGLTGFVRYETNHTRIFCSTSSR